MTGKKIERAELEAHEAHSAVVHTAASSLFAGGGEVGALLAGIDWAHTPLGPVEQWPQALRTSLRICLTSRHDIILWWGPDLRVFYNDAYAPTLGIHHPAAAGQPGRVVWAEIWDVIGPMLEGVMRTGEPTWSYDELLYLERNGYPEETYHTFSYSPIEDDSGEVGGVFTAVTETTLRVLAERRAVVARDLAAAVVDARTAEEVCARALHALAADPNDVPFALLYLLDRAGNQAHLAASTGLAPGMAAAPYAPALVDLTAPAREPAGPDAACMWPLAQVARTSQRDLVTDSPAWPGTLTPLARRALPPRVMVLPITEPGQPAPSAILVAGVNPHRALDDDYEQFYSLLASHLAAALASAHAYEVERQRAEALEEIDRAKTVFFSNVSHEFRTPLTLMLGPLEDLLSGNHLRPAAQSQVEMVHRNGLRLLKLVNTLLDFSRIEAGRAQAVYVPTDLAALTADLASTFRSVVERAGLRLVVECPPLREPVYVDHDMWEKIVLNLLSNAFKFTFAGDIEVSLHLIASVGAHGHAPSAEGVHPYAPTPSASVGTYGGVPGVELRVRDTGTGIPPEEMPRLFERFHRVRDVASRTHEGSGIGLALVRDLVQLHGGAIRAESEPGVGTTFIVTLPLGTAHLPADRIEGNRTATSTALGAAPFVAEAQRWLPDDTQVAMPDAGMDWLHDEAFQAVHPAPSARPAGPPARILVADDNSDMRAYLRHLLSERYAVDTVSNGARALAAARERPPDLVLSDVMMPELDGFALLDALRDDPRTRDIPVILLSARAGEEAIIEGLEAGADDYLIKPFSAREVLARVASHLEIARLRRETLARVRQLETVFATMADGLVLYDANGGLRQWNDALAEMFEFERMPGYVGLPVEERPANLRVRDAHDQPVPAAELPFMRAARGETLTGAEAVDLIVTTPSGTEKYVSASAAPLRDDAGQVTGAVTVYRDVTERRQLERRTLEALTALLDITRALVAAPGAVAEVPGVSYPTELEQHILELVHRVLPVRYASLFTVTPGTDVLELRALAGYPRAQEALVRQRNVGQPLGERLARAGLRDRLMAGETVVLDLRDPIYAEQVRLYGATQAIIVPVRIGERFVGTLGLNPLDQVTLTSRDLALAEGVAQMAALVIERDRLLRERAETAGRNVALTETNRRMSEFLSIASHELRTPLTSMSVHVQMAERGLRALFAEDGPALPAGVDDQLQRVRHMLERTDRQMKRLERLIADLLDVSRIAAGKLEMRPARCDLREIVREAVEEQQGAWPGREITLDLPGHGALMVEADADRIGQVVTNYLTNALKYSDGDQPVAVAVRARGARARVSVRDHGPGLTRAQREHLWEEFYRVPEIASRSGSGVGLGLGLYLCRTIVERHDGQVGLETYPGDGSTFWFTLPLAEGAAPDGNKGEG